MEARFIDRLIRTAAVSIVGLFGATAFAQSDAQAPVDARAKSDETARIGTTPFAESFVAWKAASAVEGAQAANAQLRIVNPGERISRSSRPRRAPIVLFMLGSCIARGRVVAASVHLHTGFGAGAAAAEEGGALDRALERSLPDVTRWLARFDPKPARIPARNAAHSPVELGVPLPERAELVAIPLDETELRTGSGEPNQWIGCAGFSTVF